MSIFENISQEEKESLLNYPAYISLLAANKDGVLDEEEKKAAVELYKSKTVSSEALLKEFYTLQDEIFETNLIQIDKKLPKEKAERESILQTELIELSKVLSKLDEKYRIAMHKNMESFKEHVSKAHRSVFVNLIFPLPLSGLTD